MGTLANRVGRLEDAIDQRALAIVRRPGFPMRGSAIIGTDLYGKPR